VALILIVGTPTHDAAALPDHEVWTAGLGCGGLVPAHNPTIGDAVAAIPPWTTFLPGLVLGADGTARHWWCGGALVPTLTEVAAISAIASVGWDLAQQFVALRTDGSVWTWWSLGGPPVPVAGVPPAHAVSGHLVLTRTGTVWAWQPGGPPRQVARLEGIVAVAAGGPGEGLALDEDGRVWTWGGDTGPDPAPIVGLADIVAIAAGHPFGMALQRDGTVWRWGELTFWRSCEADEPRPTRLATGAVGIGGGVRNGFVLKADGSVWGWGHNGAGLLGDDTQESRCELSRTHLFGAVAAAASWHASAFVVPVPRLASVAFRQSRLTGCRTATGTVALSGHVPAGEVRVALSSDTPHARVPPTLVLRAGQRARSFALATDAVAGDEALVVTAVSDDAERGLSDTASTTVTLAPMGVSRAWLTPDRTTGGLPVSMAVVLPCAAGPGDVVVDLATSDPAVAAPPAASVTIPRGAQAVLFPVATQAVAEETTVRVSAAVAGSVKTRRLVVTPP
jgi:hypothetical protein